MILNSNTVQFQKLLISVSVSPPLIGSFAYVTSPTWRLPNTNFRRTLFSSNWTEVELWSTVSLSPAMFILWFSVGSFAFCCLSFHPLGLMLLQLYLRAFTHVERDFCHVDKCMYLCKMLKRAVVIRPQLHRHDSNVHSLVPQGTSAAWQPRADGCSQRLQGALPSVHPGPSPPQRKCWCQPL